jgi:O-antigen/teichoic acid export membrane protein
VVRTLFVVISIFILIAFKAYFVDLNNAGTFSWILLALLVSIISGPVSGGLAGCGKMGISSTSGFISSILQFTFQVIAVYFGFGVAGLAGGFIAGTLVSTAISLRFLDLHIVSFKWRHIKSLTSFSFWLFLTSSGMIIYVYADQVLIGYYLTDADVGLYGVVSRLVSVAIFATLAIRGTLWPKVSFWGKRGETELIEGALSRAFSYSLLFAIPILTGGILLGDKLLYFLYGSVFAAGYITLVIVLAVQVVNVFQNFFTMYLDALNHQKDSFKVTAISMVANIILNVILIPRIGIAGAAIATLLTMILNSILAQRILSRIITIRIERDTLLNILIASIIMSLGLGVYRLIIPITNIWLTLVPVISGAVLFSILILKIDIKIHNDLKGIMTQMNLPWPDWL